MLSVLAEPEVRENELLPVGSNEDVDGLEVPVDESPEGLPFGIHSAGAGKVGEGGGDLSRDGADQPAGDVGFLPLVLDEEALEGPVVAIHDDVDEAFVLGHLVVPEDPRVRQGGERRQLELGGVDAALVEAVEPDLLHGEAGMAPKRVNRAERAAPESVLYEPEQLAGSERGRVVTSADNPIRLGQSM